MLHAWGGFFAGARICTLEKLFLQMLNDYDSLKPPWASDKRCVPIRDAVNNVDNTFCCQRVLCG